MVFGFAPGGTPYGTLGIQGRIDEVRISRAVLYPFTVYEDFGSNLDQDGRAAVPARRATGVTPHTRLLWHFDECAGDPVSNVAILRATRGHSRPGQPGCLGEPTTQASPAIGRPSSALRVEVHESGRRESHGFWGGRPFAGTRQC